MCNAPQSSEVEQFGWVSRPAHLLVALACVASAFIVLRATSRGVGLSPDSLQYFAASESAAAGHRLTTFGWDGRPKALTHYPPGYPLLLAAGARLGWRTQDFARYANIALFATTIVLVALLVRRLAPEPAWAAPVAVISCALAPDLIVIHSMAWSEPLYLTLTVAQVVALSAAVQQRSRMWLALAAAAAAAAALVRYVGVANIALVALAVAVCWPASRWRRLGIAAAMSALASLPLFVALVQGASNSDGQVANRELLWHPISFSDMRIAASVVAKWITPLSDATYLSGVWLVALSVLGVAVLVARARRRASRDLSPAGHGMALMLLLFTATYVAVLVLAMSLVDAQTTFEPRMLSPLLAVAIILGVAWLARQTRHGGTVRLVALAILALLISATVVRFFPWQRDAHLYGLALQRLDREGEALVLATRQLPADAQIYSNDPYFLRVQTKRMAAGLPRELDPNSLLPNTNHAEQVRAICDSATRHPTFLVLFDRPMSGDSTAQATAAKQSGKVARLDGGLIIQVRPGCTP